MNKDTADLPGQLERCSGDALMASGATAISWLLSLGLAGVGDPEGCAGKFANFSRPSYLEWAAFDIVFVGGGSAIAHGLRVTGDVNPRGSGDE
jgi:hypothetical protein